MEETYWSNWECPEDGCEFAFGFQHVKSEDEGREILRAIVSLHVRQRHPGLEVTPTILTIEPTAPGRPKLVN